MYFDFPRKRSYFKEFLIFNCTPSPILCVCMCAYLKGSLEVTLGKNGLNDHN